MDIGTTFHIYLPAGEKKSKTKKIKKNIQDSGIGKVLLMDDESIVREIAPRIFALLVDSNVSNN